MRRLHRLALSALLSVISLPAAAQDIPNLVGTWKGTGNGIHIGPTPYRAAEPTGAIFAANPIEFTYRITEQQDNRFAGEVSGGAITETLIGAIQPDNRGGIMLDGDGQYLFTLRDPNTMDLCYSHLNPTSRVVDCITVTRSQ